MSKLPTPTEEQAVMVLAKVHEIFETILPGQRVNFALFVLADEGSMVFSDAPNQELLKEVVGKILGTGPSKILDYRTKAES